MSLTCAQPSARAHGPPGLQGAGEGLSHPSPALGPSSADLAQQSEEEQAEMDTGLVSSHTQTDTRLPPSATGQQGDLPLTCLKSLPFLTGLKGWHLN